MKTSPSKSRVSEMFTPQRLLLARRRKKMTAKALAEALDISTAQLSKLETGKATTDEAILHKAASILDVSVEFLCAPELEQIPAEAATFRSLARMTAASRDSATTAASYAFALSDWVDARYNLPEWEALDFAEFDGPAAAARELRARWGVGEKPIKDIIMLLESKGIRVFSLAEQDLAVDAYSCWRNSRPYVFLNTIKSGEHTVFDAAHELGHLILHRHGTAHKGVEHEANMFASEFLMPARDVRAEIPRVIAMGELIKKKRRWNVSLAALVYRLRHLGKLTEARYRGMYIDMGQKGYRKNEPNPIAPPKSTMWRKVLMDQWQQKRTLSNIASEIRIPEREVSALVFQLGEPIDASALRGTGRPSLRVVS